MSASFALSLEEALSLSLDGSRELASSRQAWVSARENVYLSSGSGDFNLTFSGSGSVSRTDIGSGFKSSDTHSNKISLSKIFTILGK